LVGGPAGMMAAIAAKEEINKFRTDIGEAKSQVILLEKNKLLGRKILITGKGRCNITNNADISEFINNIPINGKFLYSSFILLLNNFLIKTNS
jgi:predicted flavoprotein YhiN